MSQSSVSRKQELYGFQAPTIHTVMPPCNVRGVAQAVTRRLLTAAAWVRAEVRSSGVVVDKVALGQVFSEYFRFPCQFSIHRLLHTHRLSSRAGTKRQLVADVTSGLSHPTTRKQKKLCHRVGWQVITNVSEENTTSSFRA
jgi:hypothetical protein